MKTKIALDENFGGIRVSMEMSLDEFEVVKAGLRKLTRNESPTAAGILKGLPTVSPTTKRAIDEVNEDEAERQFFKSHPELNP